MKNLLLNNELVSIELDNNIIFTTLKVNSVDLDIAKKAVDYRLNVMEDKRYLLVSDIRIVKNSTKQARDFLASKAGCEGVIAAAVIIDSSVGSMIGNFFISISKPLVPTKIFTNELDAKKWLSSYSI
jgi:hypothetical protein